MAGTRAVLRATVAVAVLLASGVTVDLDGDGVREIVAIVPTRSGQELKAWTEVDASWVPVGTVRLEGSAAGGPDLHPLAPTDGSGLVLMRDGERERAILATVPTDGESVPRCCVTLFEVVLGGDRLAVRPIGPNLGIAAGISAADLDDDGRDELVVTAPIDPTGPAPPFEDVRLLRWRGDTIVSEPVRYPEDAGLLVAIGDSDGIPGADLHFMADRSVTRISAADDGLRTETAVLPDGTTRRSAKWIAGATAGVLVTVDDTSRLATFRWPRGARPSPIASLALEPFPSVFLLGEGEVARILAMTSTSWLEQPIRTQIYDLGLELQDEVVPVAAVEAMAELSGSDGVRIGDDPFRARPQFGPLTTTTEQGVGFLVPGSLLELTGDGELAMRPTVPFAGTGTLGLAGADDGWLVSGLGWPGFVPAQAYLSGAAAGTPLVVVPLDALVGGPDGEPPDVTVNGGALVEGPEGAVVYTAGRELELGIRASPGAWAFAHAGASVESAAVVDGHVVLRLRPHLPDDGEAPDQGTVVVVEPGGIARVATWSAVVLDGPPDLRASTSAQLFGFTSIVAGRVGGPAAVTVDGAPVSLREDGSFSVEVDAPIWGREVQVRAVDPVGQETVQQLTAVGFVDYRGLPWLVIIGAITVAIGIALFVRVPRTRPAAVAVRSDGDGVLEEMDPERG